MHLPSAVRRLLGRETAGDVARARAAAAEKAVRGTQDHYRDVTGVDSRGHPTRPDRKQPRR